MKTTASQHPAGTPKESSLLPLARTHVLDLIAHLERAAILSQGVHGILQQRGEEDLARVVWVEHLEEVAAAEALGEAAGVEVTVE